MDHYKFLIDNKKLELLKKSCNIKEKKKLDKKLEKLFTGLNRNSLKLLSIMESMDSPGKNIDQKYSIGKRAIVIIKTTNQLEQAIKSITRSTVIGFDTEQKPTFKKGESQKKISIVQIATESKCYIVQMNDLKDITGIKELISSTNIKKIGFGLGNDIKELEKQFGIKPASFFDLSSFIKSTFLSRNSIGAKKAVAIFLKQKLQKSKNAALSNWEKPSLTPSQITYASEDATAPLDVYNHIIKEYNFLDEVNILT